MKSKIRQCIVFGVLVLVAMKALAQDLPTAKPEDVGFSSERLAYIDAFLTEKVSHGDLAGIVTLISRHGKVVHFSAIGYADLEKQRKMEKDTIWAHQSTHDSNSSSRCQPGDGLLPWDRQSRRAAESACDGNEYLATSLFLCRPT